MLKSFMRTGFLLFTISSLALFLFLFLRFYNIHNSFFFINDMGRDMLVLQQWQNTGKPPLLGPQTSALPFNQSAIYYYLLYPGFLITHGNPMSSLYTLTVFYLLFFIIFLYLSIKKVIPVTSYLLLVTFYLISIHPQYIAQARFVWNPSFVTPFLIASIISFYLLLQKFSIKNLLLFSLSISLAVSISYSVAPLLIMFFIFWLLFDRRRFIFYLISIFLSFLIINLPTVFFELRHHFLLTTALLTKTTSVKVAPSILGQINNLSQNIFFTSNHNLNLFLFIATILTCLYNLFHFHSKTKSLPFLTSFLFVGITIIDLIAKIPIESHYIFTLTSLLFIIIATLPKFLNILIILFFSFLYLRSNYLTSYFKPARRTYTQMQQCFANYCSSFKESTFVSVQSGFLPFHNGPEHRYLMKLAGCKVVDIETENGTAQYMTVVVDDSTFGAKTSFYELDLFGKHQEVSRTKCLPNFEIVLLKKQ